MRVLISHGALDDGPVAHYFCQVYASSMHLRPIKSSMLSKMNIKYYFSYRYGTGTVRRSFIPAITDTDAFLHRRRASLAPSGTER